MTKHVQHKEKCFKFCKLTAWFEQYLFKHKVSRLKNSISEILCGFKWWLFSPRHAKNISSGGGGRRGEGERVSVQTTLQRLQGLKLYLFRKQNSATKSFGFQMFLSSNHRHNFLWGGGGGEGGRVHACSVATSRVVENQLISQCSTSLTINWWRIRTRPASPVCHYSCFHNKKFRVLRNPDGRFEHPASCPPYCTRFSSESSESKASLCVCVWVCLCVCVKYEVLHVCIDLLRMFCLCVCVGCVCECVCVCSHARTHVLRRPLVSDTFKTWLTVWGLISASCSKLNGGNRSILSEVMGKNVFGVFFANL